MSIVDAAGQPIDPDTATVPDEEVTEGGLIVPKGTKKLERKVFTDWKLIRRAVKALIVQGARIHMVCEKCNTQCVPQDEARELRCDCTVWEIQ
jgi:hypothetical protein